MANYFRPLSPAESAALHSDLLAAVEAVQKARARIQRLAPQTGADAKAGDANARLVAKLTAALNEADRAAKSF